MSAGQCKRNDVGADPRHSPDHDLRSDPGELMNRRQPTDEDVVADLAVSAERGRGGKDHVIADDPVVADMAAIHEVAAIPNARHPTASDGTGIHGALFANNAAFSDFQACQVDGLRAPMPVIKDTDTSGIFSNFFSKVFPRGMWSHPPTPDDWALKSFATCLSRKSYAVSNVTRYE